MPQLDAQNQFYTTEILFVQAAQVGLDTTVFTDIFDTVEFQGIEMTLNIVVNSIDSNPGTQDLELEVFTLEHSDDAGFANPELIPAERIIGDINDMEVNVTGQQIIYNGSIGLKGTKRYIRGKYLYDFTDGANPAPFFYVNVFRYPSITPTSN